MADLDKIFASVAEIKAAFTDDVVFDDSNWPTDTDITNISKRVGNRFISILIERGLTVPEESETTLDTFKMLRDKQIEGTYIRIQEKFQGRKGDITESLKFQVIEYEKWIEKLENGKYDTNFSAPVQFGSYDELNEDGEYESDIFSIDNLDEEY